MSTLEVVYDSTVVRIPFNAPQPLGTLLRRHGLLLPQPCGGRGACGKCRVTLAGKCSPPDAAEQRFGTRLACRAVLLGDCRVELARPSPMRMALDAPPLLPGKPRPGLGAAVDVGTTTLAAAVYDLSSGALVGCAGQTNPQAAVSADVMGRIAAAMDGQEEVLRRWTADAVEALLSTCADGASVGPIVFTGNTAMLCLLSGADVSPLARAPFAGAPHFGVRHAWHGHDAYWPPCPDAFAGADVLCGVLATELTAASEPALLLDIGTNSEMALWDGTCLTLCAAAAGPAFEGAAISCGMGSVAGAIDRVWLEGNRPGVHVIGGGEALGICGSGLMDAMACLLRLGWMDATGAADATQLPLTSGVSLLPSDIRQVQLAKAAIAAGVRRLLAERNLCPGDLRRVLLAGGFGQGIRRDSAAAIGLLPPPLTARAESVGNAALRGAALLLMDPALSARADAIARDARWLSLSGDAAFERMFLEAMNFPGPRG